MVLRNFKINTKLFNKKLIAFVAGGLIVLLLSLLVFINGFNMPFLLPWKKDKNEPVKEVSQPIRADKPSDLEIEELLEAKENLIKLIPSTQFAPNSGTQFSVPSPSPTFIPKSNSGAIQSIPVPIPKPPIAPQAPNIKLPTLPPKVEVPKLPEPIPVVPQVKPPVIPKIIPEPVPAPVIPKVIPELAPIPKIKIQEQSNEVLPKIDIKIDTPGIDKKITIRP